MMTRLLIQVEGQTEESFVNEVLRDHLTRRGYHSVSARLMGNARLRRKRGGSRAWSSVRRDIINHLRQDAGGIVSTMVDFYGLPRSGPYAWPGCEEAARLQGENKALHLEKSLLKSVAEETRGKVDPNRFVPFVVIHEFEGLLFSDCKAFSKGVGRPDLEHRFQGIRDEFDTPEDINDSPLTAPSKRVIDILPGYEKPLLGTLAVLEIGLKTIRAECPHFDDWLSRLESLIG